MVIAVPESPLFRMQATLRPLAFPPAAGFIDRSHVLPVAPAGPARIMIELTASKAALNPTTNPRHRIRDLRGSGSDRTAGLPRRDGGSGPLEEQKPAARPNAGIGN